MDMDSWLAIWIVFSTITGTITAMLMFQGKEWFVDILEVWEVEDPALIEAYCEANPEACAEQEVDDFDFGDDDFDEFGG